MKGNPRSETEVVRSTYMISGTLCAFRNHVVSDFWVYTFRFLNM